MLFSKYKWGPINSSGAIRRRIRDWNANCVLIYPFSGKTNNLVVEHPVSKLLAYETRMHDTNTPAECACVLINLADVYCWKGHSFSAWTVQWKSTKVQITTWASAFLTQAQREWHYIILPDDVDVKKWPPLVVLYAAHPVFDLICLMRMEYDTFRWKRQRKKCVMQAIINLKVVRRYSSMLYKGGMQTEIATH